MSRVVRRDLLGHSPEDITDDYTHSTIEARRRAVELLCQTPIEHLVEIPIKSGKRRSVRNDGTAKLLILW